MGPTSRSAVGRPAVGRPRGPVGRGPPVGPWPQHAV